MKPSHVRGEHWFLESGDINPCDTGTNLVMYDFRNCPRWFGRERTNIVLILFWVECHTEEIPVWEECHTEEIPVWEGVMADSVLVLHYTLLWLSWLESTTPQSVTQLSFPIVTHTLQCTEICTFTHTHTQLWVFTADDAEWLPVTHQHTTTSDWDTVRDTVIRSSYIRSLLKAPFLHLNKCAFWFN